MLPRQSGVSLEEGGHSPEKGGRAAQTEWCVIGGGGALTGGRGACCPDREVGPGRRGPGGGRSLVSIKLGGGGARSLHSIASVPPHRPGLLAPPCLCAPSPSHCLCLFSKLGCTVLHIRCFPTMPVTESVTVGTGHPVQLLITLSPPSLPSLFPPPPSIPPYHSLSPKLWQSASVSSSLAERLRDWA